MHFVTTHPSAVFVLSFLALWAATAIGAAFKKRRPLDENLRQDFNLILASTLTLLGLLIGFSFSMASTRYDQRKTYEEAEANAIGTEYLRADLLPADAAARARTLLKQYAELRVRFYTADEADVARINAETARLQKELWSAVLPPPSPPGPPHGATTVLTVAGMNDVLNAQGYTQAAWWNRIPTSAGLLMVVIAFACNGLLGYSLRSASERSKLLLVLPLVVAIAFALITDIDTPRHGLIRVVPQNLNALLASFGPR
ncbi:MAG: hypothetical protein HYZ40_12765 [Rhodospirillales bacterium]|nr:hypothetical protein [Rhodospirillales bacterium]